MSQTVPKEWRSFCEEYTSFLGYWYIPKGFTIKEENFPLLKRRLAELRRLEGKNWATAQAPFVRAIKEKGLFEPHVTGQRPEDRNAIGRMFKIVCSYLGLAWVDAKDKIVITDVGQQLLSSSAGDFSTLHHQINRYQFFNPTFKNHDHFTLIHVLPVRFLTQLLAVLEVDSLSKDEYVLFVARATSMEDVGHVADRIERFRRLPPQSQSALVDFLASRPISPRKAERGRRSSIHNTIKLNASYALQFFGSSNYLEYQNEGLIMGAPKAESDRFNSSTAKSEIWVDFKTRRDWFYYFGRRDFPTSVEFAIDYYTDISDIENASELLRKARKRGLRIPSLAHAETYRSVMVNEKVIEEYLEDNITDLEPGLKVVGRQYSTLTGPIDLLAKDKEGNHVIIELKKNRASDRVVGQVSRYVTDIRRTMNPNVRVIIVGRHIDNSLKLARESLRFPCSLYTFDFKVSFKRIA